PRPRHDPPRHQARQPLLNNQGVVKVADLGLVRTPGLEDEKPIQEEIGSGGGETSKASTSGKTGKLVGLSAVTPANQGLGTPAYMAPEQARNATKVDQRADVYSLGCTLYALVTGRPLFQGSNALEVITKHAMEPVVRPEVVVKELPRALSDIIVKMVAKK